MAKKDEKEQLEIYMDSEDYTHLLYHIDCRALIGKANIMNKFDDFEFLCHNCKKIVPLKKIKFARIKKNKGT